jgi:negative regulator of flagellin synthesis FlgM
MEINSLLKNVDPYRATFDAKAEAVPRQKTGVAGQAQTPGQTPGQAGDRVSLSPSALLHTTAHAAANAAPDIRQEKVDNIKDRLADGSYAVDAKKIAEKLVQSEAFLAGALSD